VTPVVASRLLAFFSTSPCRLIRPSTAAIGDRRAGSVLEGGALTPRRPEPTRIPVALKIPLGQPGPVAGQSCPVLRAHHHLQAGIPLRPAKEATRERRGRFTPLFRLLRHTATQRHQKDNKKYP
jgi:hypothetical protein